MAQTLPRQNYHAECEAGVNKQINLELYASYVYQSMVSIRGYDIDVFKAMAPRGFDFKNGPVCLSVWMSNELAVPGKTCGTACLLRIILCQPHTKKNV